MKALSSHAYRSRTRFGVESPGCSGGAGATGSRVLGLKGRGQVVFGACPTGESTVWNSHSLRIFNRVQPTGGGDAGGFADRGRLAGRSGREYSRDVTSGLEAHRTLPGNSPERNRVAAASFVRKRPPPPLHFARLAGGKY